MDSGRVAPVLSRASVPMVLRPGRNVHLPYVIGRLPSVTPILIGYGDMADNDANTQTQQVDNTQTQQQPPPQPPQQYAPPQTQQHYQQPPPTQYGQNSLDGLYRMVAGLPDTIVDAIREAVTPAKAPQATNPAVHTPDTGQTGDNSGQTGSNAANTNAGNSGDSSIPGARKSFADWWFSK